MWGKFKYIAMAALLVAIAFNVIQYNQLQKVKGERDKQKQNVATLMKGAKQYETESGLNAAKVDALYLSLAQYKQYRAADAELIKQLKAKQKNLSTVKNVSTETDVTFQTIVKDSIIYLPTDTITAHCVDFKDQWLTLQGCAEGKAFNGKISLLDTLLITETIKYKRFLFWKTRKEKSRSIDVVSRNPYTKINGVDFVKIEK